MDASALPPGHPSIPGLGAVAMAPPPATAPPPALPHALAETARTMAERGGLDAAAIAGMLSLDVQAVRAALGGNAAGGNTAGKRVGDPLQLRLDALLEEEADVCCPVTLTLLVDAVQAADGFVYERSAAEALCTGASGRFVSPMTREELCADFAAAAEFKERASAFRRERTAAMLAFAEEAALVQQPSMAMGVIDRVSEYLAAMPPETVALFSASTVRACDALLTLVHSHDTPLGTWHAKPQQLRRVNALKMQVTAGGGADMRQLTCLVCFDEYPVLKGLECGEEGEAGSSAARHFVCEECLCGHVTSAVDADSIDLFRQRGGVSCVHPECQRAPFTDGALARALPANVFQRYVTAKEKVAEQRINAELEAGFEARLKIEREKAGGDGRRQAVKEHIVERILTLSCPRCKQAFVDFNGCLALTCSRAGCGCGFCAICQEDCGNDAHAHVGRGCPLAEQVGIRPREFHVDDGEYTRGTTQLKAKRLAEYLTTLPEAHRQHALEDCATELADLGLDPKTLLDGGERGARREPNTRRAVARRLR